MYLQTIYLQRNSISKWFPFPLLCFQASQGRSWENPFPLMNRHLLTPVLESWVGGLLAAPQGTAPNPEDLVRCTPHWVQVPSFPPSPPETVSRCAQRSSTWMTPVAPMFLSKLYTVSLLIAGLLSVSFCCWFWC